ncbi:hypothetical protein Goshw_002928 [Gossypium schwendimanii]|uniref:Leucine-rich repeat-containing N-terminal plant-type domain-containing protein n=1 Tax=Gossypium schwendimanii TaxID=34291 RepID=A0A7J9KVU4_GOSSC|nr:hypothetical protein [Gossypium schwendimanii]
MEKSMAVGLMLVVLCVITGEFACNGSGIDPQALFDLGNDLTHPETNLSYGSSKRSNCSQRQGIVCNNNNGVLLMIHIPDLGPLNSESSSRVPPPSLGNLSGLQLHDVHMNFGA